MPHENKSERRKYRASFILDQHKKMNDPDPCTDQIKAVFEAQSLTILKELTPNNSNGRHRIEFEAESKSLKRLVNILNRHQCVENQFIRCIRKSN